MFALPSNIRSQDLYTQKQLERNIDQAIVKFQGEQYFAAINICNDIISKSPNEPLGYLGAASIYHGIMRNYWTNSYHAEFDSLINLAVNISETRLNQNKEHAQYHFYYGAARGIRGLQHLRQHEWFSAFRDGLIGYNHVKKAYQLDNTIYDAYLGLGLFYYWKSAKAKILTFLKFMKDEREKGIEYIKIAINKGRFSILEGEMVLIQILLNEKRYEEALNECQKIESNFSNDPTWLYLSAEILMNLERWDEAKNYYLTLYKKLKNSKFTPCFGYMATCEYQLAHCDFQLNEISSAQEWIRKATQTAQRRTSGLEIEGPLCAFEDTYTRIKLLQRKLEHISGVNSKSN